MILPHFEDTGHDGTWLDAILHSPCLDVRDYAGHSIPNVSSLTGAAPTIGSQSFASAASESLNHVQPTTPGEEHNNAR